MKTEDASIDECLAHIMEYGNYLCGLLDGVKPSPEVNLTDGIGEATINGVDYQLQIRLEPNKEEWVVEDKPTFRKVVY